MQNNFSAVNRRANSNDPTANGQAQNNQIFNQNQQASQARKNSRSRIMHRNADSEL